MDIENLEKIRHTKTGTQARNRRAASSGSFFYIGMSLFLLLFVFLGFWPSYFGTVLSGTEMAPPMGGVLWVIHLHALVFVAWFLLIIIETILIIRRRIATHMRIGRYGMLLGAAVFLTGVLVVSLEKYAFISRGQMTVAEGTLGAIGVWMQMINFALFLYLGYRYRRKPGYHKRYMLFATISIMPAALFRLYTLPLFFYLFGYWSLLVFSVLIILIVLAHDLYTLRRIHKATLLGTALFALSVALIILGFQ